MRDVVKIYDGPSSNSSKLRELSGENLSPGTITSSGKYMYIIFTSDGSTEKTGFSAIYRGMFNICYSCIRSV